MSEIEHNQESKQHPAFSGWVRRNLPAMAAFVAGFAVMSLELLEARLVAPYFGSSVLVWTNIIGVILVALAIGAWAGGAITDKYPRASTVALFLLGAGLWSAGLSGLGRVILVSFSGMPIQTVSALASLILFAPPALLLGAVPPAVLRLSVEDVKQSGHTAGLLTAIGTAGSLAGTYLTGYFLLPLFSVNDLLAAVAAVLVLCAVALGGKIFSRRSFAAVGILGIVAVPNTFIGDRLLPGEVFPSAFNHVMVTDMAWHGAPARILLINMGFHSGALTDKPLQSVFDYVTTLQATDQIMAEPKNLLLIGGGGMHIADEFLQRHPNAHVDIAEIDPSVYQAALKAFGLRDPERVTMHFEDARPVVNQSPASQYDVIVADAFSGDLCVPWQLLTREAMAGYKRVLKPDGVMAFNVIMPDVDPGPGTSAFKARFYATLHTAFGWSESISTMEPKDPKKVSNILVFAGNGTKPDSAALLAAVQQKYGVPAARLMSEPADGAVWTDDAGPADYASLAMYGEAWPGVSER